MLFSSRFREMSAMSKVFQAKTSRVNDDLLLLESVLWNRFPRDFPNVAFVYCRSRLASLPSMMLYLDEDFTIWNCNMIVLDSGYVLTCSYIMSTELPPSIYILLTLYATIIVVMTTGLNDGTKVSHGMLRNGTCD
ncbi:hypothetical protein Tco_1151063 [Tanacetum coccineum]